MEFTILHEFPRAGLEAAWRDCLQRVECPAHYDAPEFFLEPFWAGRSPFAVLALSDGAVTGVLTGLHEGGGVNVGLPSRPQICADASADRAATLNALARGLLEEAGTADLVSVYTWPSLTLEPFQHFGFRRRQLQGDVILDLRRGSEALWKDLTPERRRNIRQAMKRGVQVRPMQDDSDIRAAYEAYLGWRRTSRKIIIGDEMPAALFDKVCRMTANSYFLLAHHAGQVVGVSVFRFFPRGLVEFAANYSRDEFLHLNANALLQWEGIRWACAEGFPQFSMGGAHVFLRRFGGAIVPVLRYRLDRTWLRQHDLKEALRDRARGVVRKLPAPIETAVRKWTGHERRAGY